MLKSNEIIDDLQLNGLRIIQNNNAFKFGMDAVLLSSFATVKKNAEVLDLGTGTGILPILLSGKTEAAVFKAIEIQEDMAEMAQRSCKLNNLSDKIQIIHGNLLNIKNYLQPNTFDTVVSNPPYKKQGSGMVSSASAKAVARSEIACTLEDVVKSAAFTLKDKGNFAMVHRPERLAEIIITLTEYKLEPKRIQLVYPTINQPPTMVLIEAIKSAKPFVINEPPLIVRDQNGQYTKQIHKIYGSGVLNE